MLPSQPTDPAHSTSGWLEDLVASALEVLDRAGEAGLDELLQQHPQHRTQVLELVARFRGTGLLARDARDEIPQRLGDFRLLERLGSGGMGVVFLAEQESLGRTVALKVIRPDLAFFAGTRERFRREIEVIAKLSHPAIVPIVATGEHAGMPWYAMPRIVGCNVDEACRRLRGRDPATLRGSDLEAAIRHGSTDSPSQVDRLVFAGPYWEACVRLVRQAALGLEHAHRAGIVHRDVKPSNLMLTPDGRAMLVDFGLARVQGDAKLTRTGGEPGSPAFMAPEQVRGLGADERADVYSLAATLFQLLDLEPPFQAPDAEALRAQILQGRLGGLRNRAVPTELRHVVAMAMDVDRERRYPTAAALVDDLDAVLARRPIQARRLPLHVRVLRWSQRHRTASVLSAAALLLATVVPAVLAWQQSRALELVRIEKGHAEHARDQALLAVREFLTVFASGKLSTIPGAQTIGGPLLERAVTLLETMPDVDPFVAKQYRTHVDRYRVAVLRLRMAHQAAVELARRTLQQWDGAGTVPPGIAFLLVALRCEIARCAVDGAAVPDVDALLEPCERELALAATDGDLRSGIAELRASLAMQRAALADRRGEHALAERVLAQAIADAQGSASMRDQASTLAVMRNRYGDMLRDRGDLEGATAEFTATCELLRPAVDPALGDPTLLRLRAHALWGLGRVAVMRERWDDSRAHLQAAADEFEHDLRAYPTDQDSTVGLASVLTELAQVQRQRKVAAATVTAMLERGERLFAHCPDALREDVQARNSALVNASVLSEQYWNARQPAPLARMARRMTALAGGDAMRHSQAAWRLLQAATLFEDANDEATARGCDDDALAALVACDAAGWFPPINLDDGPCQRLAERTEFAALRAKHPPEQASRRRPR